jgi:hypothetical protein
LVLRHRKRCTTFNGHKLLLLKGNKDFSNLKELDPHFLNDDHPVIARFKPDDTGWKLARKCILEMA